MDAFALSIRPGSALAGATAETAAPPGINRLSKSPRTTQALLPDTFSPAGLGAEHQEVEQPRQEQGRLTEDIRQAADKINEYMRLSDTHLQFVVAEQTGRIVVKVVDSLSQELVRQIPSESVLRFADTLRQVRGLLYDNEG